MPNNDTIFSHRPLDHPGSQIRLLRLCHASADDSPLDLFLERHSLENPPLYHAISYTWGKEQPTQDVFINSQRFSVGANCHYALWQYRLHFPGSLVWIDSICIDQVNLVEKSSQVQAIGRIFQGAELVAACIGPHADDSELVLSTCGPPPTISARLRKAVSNFTKRPYWHRVWVAQEFLLAWRLWILCGPDAIPEWKMTHAELFQIVVPMHQYQLLHTRSPVHKDAGRMLLADAIRLFRKSQCQNPLDHVYGLLQLCSPKSRSRVRVDYGVSACELALHTAKLSDSILSFQTLVETLLPLFWDKMIAEEEWIAAKGARRIVHKAGYEILPVPAAVLSAWDKIQQSSTTKLGPPFTKAKVSDFYIRVAHRSLRLSENTHCRLYGATSSTSQIEESIPAPTTGTYVYLSNKPSAIISKYVQPGDYLLRPKLGSGGNSRHVLFVRRCERRVCRIVGQGYWTDWEACSESLAVGKDFVLVLSGEDLFFMLAQYHDGGDWEPVLEFGVEGREFSSFAVACFDEQDE